MKPKESRKFFEEKSRRANENEREQKVFRKRITRETVRKQKVFRREEGKRE